MINKSERKRQSHGWFASGERSYATLLKSDSVQLLAETYSPKSRATNLYALKHFLDENSVSPDELLGLHELEIKKCIKKTIMNLRSQRKFAQARKIFYVVRRFLELNDREVHFKRTLKKILLKQEPTKNGRQYVPTKQDVFRMVDSFPLRNKLQQLRGRAILLCLWQSGVRSSCLCSWKYGMFRETLYPMFEKATPIKVLARREQDVCDCAEDTKCSSYAVGYYYTFLASEASLALKNYLDQRMKEGWQPKDSDPVFVTHGTVSNGEPLNPQHIIEIVKNGAEQIGIKPQTIWTHCFRKAFRKSLYMSGLDNDICEGLMGHKLPASRSSYYDYHDIKFARNHYLKGNWSRIGYDLVKEMEEKTSFLEERVKELEAMITPDMKLQSAMETRLEELETLVKLQDPKKLEDMMRKIMEKVKWES